MLSSPSGLSGKLLGADAIHWPSVFHTECGRLGRHSPSIGSTEITAAPQMPGPGSPLRIHVQTMCGHSVDSEMADSRPNNLMGERSRTMVDLTGNSHSRNASVTRLA